MAIAPAAPLALPPIGVLFADPADMRLALPDKAPAEGSVRKHVPAMAGAAVKRAMPLIATTPGLATMAPVEMAPVGMGREGMVRMRMARVEMARATMARVAMVRVRGASLPRMAAHLAASFSHVPPGMRHPSASPRRHRATVSRTPLAPRPMRRRALSGSMGITRLPRRWPIRTAGCAACC
jgi:hypothetical protein